MLHDQHLEEDTGRLERDFNLLRCTFLPIQDLLNVLPGDLEVIAVPDCRLEKNSYRIWEPIWQKKWPNTWVKSSVFSANLDIQTYIQSYMGKNNAFNGYINIIISDNSRIPTIREIRHWACETNRPIHPHYTQLRQENRSEETNLTKFQFNNKIS